LHEYAQAGLNSAETLAETRPRTAEAIEPTSYMRGFVAGAHRDADFEH
jgi:hypothetical protein